MLGIRDVELKTKLLAMHPYPPSQEAIDLCRSVESVSINASELSSPATFVHTQTQINIAKSKPPSAPHAKCRYCRGSTHRDRKECSARKNICNSCGIKGHFSSVCEKAATSSIATNPTLTPGKARAIHVKDVSSKDCQPAPQISVQLSNAFSTEIYGHCSATPDTGADASVIGLSMLEYFEPPICTNCTISPNYYPRRKRFQFALCWDPVVLYSTWLPFCDQPSVSLRGPRRSSPVMAHLPRSSSHPCHLPNTDHTITCRS